MSLVIPGVRYWDGQSVMALTAGDTVTLNDRTFNVLEPCHLYPGDNADKLSIRDRLFTEVKRVKSKARREA